MPSATKRRTGARRASVTSSRNGAAVGHVPAAPVTTAPQGKYHDVEDVEGLRTTGVSENLRVDELFAEPAYNRPMSPTRVKKIADEFDPDALTPLIISERPDGMKVIIDGQHRVAALITMKWDDQKVPCYVHRGLTIEREAMLFTIMNRDRVRPTPVDLFRSRMVSGDPIAHGVQRIVTKHGLVIQDKSGNTGSIRAVSTLDRIYSGPGPDTLDRTIGILKEAWTPDQNDRFHSEILIGTAMVLTHYGHKLDDKRLATVLSKAVPNEILAKVRATRTNWRIAGGVAAMLVDLYNNRLRENGKRLALESPSYFSRTFGWSRP